MKPFLIKCLLLAAIVYGLQCVISRAYPMPVTGEIRQMENALTSGADILYFGDSVVFTGDRLPDMLGKRLNGPRVRMVAHPANSPVVYQEYCGFLARKKITPKLIIAPISMRYFSPDWEWDPGKQFLEERYHFRFSGTPIYPVLPFLLSFHVLPMYPRTVDEFYAMRYVYGGRDLGSLRSYHLPDFATYSDDHMRKKIQLSYVNPIAEGDPYLAAIRNVADRCGFTRVLFYITPLSFDTGERFIGHAFSRQVDANIAVIKRALSMKHAALLDLSHGLPETAFSWDLGLYMGDHLEASGRESVISRIAEYIVSHRLLE